VRRAHTVLGSYISMLVRTAHLASALLWITACHGSTNAASPETPPRSIAQPAPEKSGSGRTCAIDEDCVVWAYVDCCACNDCPLPPEALHRDVVTEHERQCAAEDCAPCEPNTDRACPPLPAAPDDFRAVCQPDGRCKLERLQPQDPTGSADLCPQPGQGATFEPPRPYQPTQPQCVDFASQKKRCGSQLHAAAASAEDPSRPQTQLHTLHLVAQCQCFAARRAILSACGGGTCDAFAECVVGAMNDGWSPPSDSN